MNLSEQEDLLRAKEDAFSEAQKSLIDQFKVKLVFAAEEVLSKLYTDVANYACTDAHTNYHNHLRDEFKTSLIKEITDGYGMYSWAHGVRMEILKLHKEELQNKIISDLKEKIAHLVDRENQMNDRIARRGY